MAENILEMKNISKTFFGVKVLDDAQLTVEKGQVHILLGENGAVAAPDFFAQKRIFCY